MFLLGMSHRTVTIPARSGIDWKGIGYLLSIVGVLLLGAKSMPKASDPSWHWPALIAGVFMSIVGFGLRYLSHLKEQREIAKAMAEAEGRKG